MAYPATTSAPARTLGDKPAQRDFRQEVTDTIVQMLEKGVAPWQKPWEAGTSALSIPFNPTSDRAYRGGNAIHLIATAISNGYEDPRWMTYKQASEQGWQVRRGEKGTHIEFWEVKPTSRDERAGSSSEGDPQSTESAARSKFIHRVYTVFNAKQIENIPDYEPARHTDFEAVQAGEQILANSGAKIAHDQADRAFYSRSQDSIHLPPQTAFKEPAGYYGTALHELAHWTGHPSRLNRQTLNESYRFGDLNYAKEELRAELASVFLAAERGIPHDPEQHASYVGSWVKALKEDKNEIFRAAHDASAAADFLLALERDRSVADEELATGVADGSLTREAEIARVEETTADLERDRERLEEVEPSAETRTAGEQMRESTERVARTEPDSGTVNVHSKAAGTDHRLTVEQHPLQSPSRSGLGEAQTITAKALGPKARALAPQTETGAYRGPIIGQTDQFVIQRQSSRFSVAHEKVLLDSQPAVGETVSINYAGGAGTVREYHERSRIRVRER